MIPFLAALALSQTAPATDLAALPAPQRDAVYHDEVDGTHWARGRTYKASANQDGFAYVPFLGSDAPRNYPVHFTLTRVERDGTPLDLESTAQVRRDGDRIVLDRGSVQVNYDLAVESVEQSFSFARPEGEGNVTLTLAVTTDLAGVSDGSALRFANDRGGVRYGEAIVLDDAGRRADVESRWTGNAIELVVPATFVNQANGPLLVDPILSTTVIDGFDAELTEPDVAYDEVDDKYLVVYSERFSGSDSDVFSQFVDGATLDSLSSRYIDQSSDSWRTPTVAQLRSTRRFMVACQAPSVAISVRSDIIGRLCEADGTLHPPAVLVTATTAYNCSTPDIGGERINFPESYYCLVYSRFYITDVDTAAVIIDSDGVPASSEILLGGFVSRDERDPNVSKSTNTGATRFNVAWRVEDLNGGDYWVAAAQIRFDGSTVFGPVEVAPRASSFLSSIDVSGLSERWDPNTGEQYYVVTYRRGGDVQVALCSGQTLHSTQSLDVLEHTPSSSEFDRWRPALATTSEHFLIAYRQNDSLGMTVAQPIDGKLALTERRLRNGGPGPAFDFTTAIATAYQGGADSQAGLAAWSTSVGVDDFDIYAAAVVADDALQASGYQYCYGTENSTGDHAYILALGDRNANQPQTLIVSSLPLNASGFFLASREIGNTPGAGGSAGTLCLSGNIGRFGLYNSGSSGQTIQSLDPQAIAQPTGTTSALAGETWRFQSWHRDSVGGGIATSNFSNAVAIPFL
ncbi:MAG: hypothetical protein AAGB93_13165 [Planctomycetota bacterium]